MKSALRVPANIGLSRLPPYPPEHNPIERVRLYLKQRYLSRRLLDDDDAIVDATVAAWQRLAAGNGRITSLCSYPWIRKLAKIAGRAQLGQKHSLYRWNHSRFDLKRSSCW